jgi:hypothetical protein
MQFLKRTFWRRLVILAHKKWNWTTAVKLVEVLISFSLAFQPQSTGVQTYLQHSRAPPLSICTCVHFELTKTKYQCNQLGALYPKIKNIIFYHYDVIGKSPKIKFQKNSWKFFSNLHNFFVSYPISSGDGLKFTRNKSAQNVGSGFFDFWLFWIFTAKIPKIFFFWIEFEID